MKKIILTLLLTFVLASISQIFYTCYAQDRSVISDSIYSDILNEQRSFKVLLPEEYEPGSEKKYEVIYLTDGEWVLNLFPFIYKFAQDEDYVPPVIIVDIPNKYINGANQRDRDFLPVHVPSPAISGGADNFLSFLKNELIPLIDKTYPTNGTNSLYGHSYGGVFVMYALLTEPQLFESYYATDPPYGWNNNYMIKLSAEKLENLPLNKILWIAGRESTYENNGISHMDSILQLKAPESLHWKVAIFPNEKHNSVRLKAMYDGIKFCYSGYSNVPLSFHPMNGILLKDKATYIFCNSYPELRYTTDGTEPDRTSPIADSRITITAPAQLVMKSFSATGKYDFVAKGNFGLGEVLPSIPKPKKIKPGGLKYSYYEGNWEKLPDFKKIKPVLTGVTDSVFNINKFPNKSNFACLFEGYVEIVKDGYYVFAIVSNDGSKLFLQNRMIIDNDGVHSTESIKSFILPLENGFYPVRIEYFQKNDNSSLQLLYLIPDTENATNIPFKFQYN
jgi:predicted alpha/beta superfamily hydrolase